MNHEIGDPAVHVNVDDVRDAFTRIGAKQGDVVMFHGSLSSMGTVDGGVTTVYDGVLAATAPHGTVAMPSLWYDGTKERENPRLFDVKTSPVYVGALAEGLRLDPRSVRSDHWTHAVGAIGERAEELCADHGKFGPRPSPWSDTAFAHGSPWQKLIDWNALYCFIGVTMRVCTIKHCIEGMLLERVLEHVPEDKRLEYRNLQMHDCQKQVYAWPYFDGERLQRILTDEGLFVTTKLGSATLGGIRTKPLVARALAIIEGDIESWLNADFIAWRQKCLEA